MKHREVIVIGVALTWFILGFAIGRASAAPRPAVQAIPAASIQVASRTTELRTEAPSEQAVLPDAATTPTPPPTVAASPQPTRHGRVSVSGFATWYCNSDPRRGRVSRCRAGYPDRPGVADLYAGVSPDLARFRGELADVCWHDRCVRVRVIDCDCQAVDSIDLYADAFERLAPLSRGRIAVTIHA
jgi:hypothetical protein